MYSKLSNAHLPRYLQPHTGAVKPCGSCAVFAAEVMVPAGVTHEGVEMLCWVCAHYVTEHGVRPGSVGVATCNCKREDIYPDEVVPVAGLARFSIATA